MKIFIYIIFITFSYSAHIKAEVQFSIAPSLLFFDYTEFNFNGSELNNETGTIPGIQLNLNTTINSHLDIKLSIAGYDGNVNYDGYTQFGSAIATTTDENIFRYSMHISTPLLNNANIFLSTTFHQWKRDIQGKGTVLGIFEKYQWREVSIGINTIFWTNEQGSWLAEAALLKTVNPEMYIDLSEADLGSTNLNLGTDTGARFQLSWVAKNTSNQNYGFSIFFETWDFGISDSNTTSGGTTSVSVYEPRSETRHSGIQFIVGFHY
ncbi:MAG: hypothetical protein OEY66_02915 [Gammaproteobacteria bacterium]|nr:hypothetical protein [Gammaproteobacteria bacterium]